MMKKVFYLLYISALFLPFAVRANDGNEQIHKGPNAAVKKYIKEQIMPVLIQKRQQFDRELSAAEKNEISACKAALKQLQNLHRDWKHNDRPTTGDNLPAPDADVTEKASNPEFAQHKAIMERLQAIADKHSNSLQDIKTQLDPLRKQWAGDIEKLLPVKNETKSDDSYYGQRHMEHAPVPFLFNHHFGAVHFLLLPVTTDEDNEAELKADFTGPEAISTPASTQLTSFYVMPNPASNDLRLGNDILPAVNQLKITDLQGKEVMTLENVQAEQHLDVSNLANGTYLIQIRSGEKVVSRKIVITR